MPEPSPSGADQRCSPGTMEYPSLKAMVKHRSAAPRLRGFARRDRNRAVMRRHHGICHVCGQPGANEVDHVVPLAHGGADDESNLRPITANRVTEQRRLANHINSWGSTTRPTPATPLNSVARTMYASQGCYGTSLQRQLGQHGLSV